MAPLALYEILISVMHEIARVKWYEQNFCYRISKSIYYGEEKLYQYNLFDLDGTLSDPKVGICTSVQYALSKMGIEEPDIDKLEPFIGPPLRDSFKEYYNMSDEEAEKAIAFYRERFSTVGKFENEIYPGIPELLRDLKKKGRTVAIASSKPTVFVEDILKHFEIRDYFDIVVGSELDGSRDKKEDILNEVLRQMFPDSEPEYDEVVMIGDRKYDIEAALNLGVMNIGVSYGYGSVEELEEAGADRIVNTVSGLRGTLIPMMGMGNASFAQRPVPESAANGENGEKSEPKDWKTASKEASRQSFARMWAFVGPALMYWIGKAAVYFLLYMIVQLIKGPDSGPLPVGLDYTFYQLGTVLVGVLLIRDFKSVIKASKERVKPSFNKADVAILGLSAILLAVGISSGMIMLDNMTAEMYANNPDLMQAAADAANTAQDAVVPDLAQYDPPFLAGILLEGILVPLSQAAIFIGLCFYRAKKTLRMMPLVLTALLFGFMNSSGGKGLVLTFTIGIAMYIYEITDRFVLSALVFVLSSMCIYTVEHSVMISDILAEKLPVAICIALGLTLLLVVNGKNKRKTDEIAKPAA